MHPPATEPDDWTFWQLADSAFPSGGLAHSSGLEAAFQLGEVRDAAGLTDFLRAGLLQAARACVPFAVAAVRGADLDDLDDRHDAVVVNAVANRASRAMGQGFVGAACRALGAPGLGPLYQHMAARGRPFHWPVAFGAVCGALGLAEARAARLFLFLTLRGQLSAAVRLGVVGPIRGQAIQFALAPEADRLAGRALAWRVDDAAQASPVLELLQGMHDRLYSRLFLS